MKRCDYKKISELSAWDLDKGKKKKKNEKNYSQKR